MPDVQKLLERAEKFLVKQKFENAFETYLEIYKLLPNDENVLQSLTDLSLKLNRSADAVRYGSALADYQIKRNDLPRAIAACRRVLKTSSQDLPTLMKLAPLLEKTQKNSEALEVYRAALELNRKAGAAGPVMECLERIFKLDSGNLEAAVHLAEAASNAGLAKIACPAYLRAAELARKGGQEDGWAKFVERAHALDPADEAASVAAAELSLERSQPREALSLLEPMSEKRPDDAPFLDLLARAYLGAKEWEKAEPLALKLYQSRPEAISLVEQVIEGLLGGEDNQKALALVDRLRTQLWQQGKSKDFLSLMEKIYKFDEDNVEVVELLTILYNEMNREEGLRRTLTRLFNLYLAAEKYDKAADTLERIIDVDPYGTGHADRLLSLEGHIDSIFYRNIGGRIQVTSAAPGAAMAGRPGEPSAGAPARTESLEDLLIEGEMYHQYQLSSKLAETLQKIDRLYPGAQEKNSRLKDLYDSTGFHPTSAPPGPAAAPPEQRTAASPSSAVSAQSLDDLRKISEITANIYRESTMQGVAQVTVDQIGRAVNASRCWVALGTADRAPSLTAENCNLGILPSENAVMMKVYAFLTRQAAAHLEGWTFSNLTNASDMTPIFPELASLGVKSLLAMPLMDKDQPAGLLMLLQCDTTRVWGQGETILLKAIAPQIVIAVNNSKLRRLVRSLAGTDPDTGLLPRGAYIDCLLAEARRAKEQSQPLSVCLIEPGDTAGLAKNLGDSATQAYVQKVGKAISSNLRQNDIAIRYNPYSIGVIFPDTPLPKGGFAVEKLRRVLAQVKIEGRDAPSFPAAVCDVPLGAGFDVVDGVTEVINRLEASLDEARKDSNQQVCLSRFEG